MPTVNLDYLNAPAPAWLSVLFVACTSFTAWLMAQAIQRAGSSVNYYWLIVGLWLTAQAGLALGAFIKPIWTRCRPAWRWAHFFRP
ncbi:hypothetical protein H9L05_20780 [Hymenobacter qilianensis]|uniref:Uncharacterized protein n=1 Tax=Hymenobacter qilianensis TaxID=1385715 RepID=A0A7H0GVC7_9BACT|nr:hypothetical protein [Hymenobacter qilianensis]QNP52243.1 hypothetical protein H9L05_20780 [Hymenobacter qilianensis]